MASSTAGRTASTASARSSARSSGRVALPVLSWALAWPTHGWSLLLAACTRSRSSGSGSGTARRDGSDLAWHYGWTCTLARFAQALGLLGSPGKSSWGGQEDGAGFLAARPRPEPSPRARVSGTDRRRGDPTAPLRSRLGRGGASFEEGTWWTDCSATCDEGLPHGGAGFIGSHIVDTLLAQGYAVTVYDNLSNGRLEFIEHHAGRPNFRFVQADLLDEDRLAAEMAGHDLVRHLAANTDIIGGAEQPRRDLRDCVIGTFNVLDAMRRPGIAPILFSSTGAVYGELCIDAASSESAGPLCPSRPTRPARSAARRSSRRSAACSASGATCSGSATSSARG